MPYRKLTPETLAQARALMADHTLTIVDVTHLSGVSPQTLYKHFPDLKGRPHRGGNPTLPVETLAQACLLMADYALTVAEVAHRAGVAPQTLYNYFPDLRRCPKLTPEELAEMRTLMADHTLTVAEVAHRAGVAPQTLYNYFPDLKGRPRRGRSPKSARNLSATTRQFETRCRGVRRDAARRGSEQIVPQVTSPPV